jgi:hypothetical protein
MRNRAPPRVFASASAPRTVGNTNCERSDLSRTRSVTCSGTDGRCSGRARCGTPRRLPPFRPAFGRAPPHRFGNRNSSCSSAHRARWRAIQTLYRSRITNSMSRERRVSVSDLESGSLRLVGARSVVASEVGRKRAHEWVARFLGRHLVRSTQGDESVLGGSSRARRTASRTGRRQRGRDVAPEQLGPIQVGCRDVGMRRSAPRSRPRDGEARLHRRPRRLCHPTPHSSRSAPVPACASSRRASLRLTAPHCAFQCARARSAPRTVRAGQPRPMSRLAPKRRKPSRISAAVPWPPRMRPCSLNTWGVAPSAQMQA